MFRPLKHALAALLLLCAPLAHAADIKPLVNSSGSIRPVHSGETVGVANGGTGAVTLTAHCVIVGNGTTAPTVACPGSSGNVLTSNGSSADPTFQASSASPGGTSGQIQYNNSGAFGGFTASGDVTINTSTGVTAIGSNKVTLGMIAQSGANTMLGNWSGSTANVAAKAMPSCSDTSGNHLNYVSGTGITCGTSSSGSGTVTTTGSPASGNLAKFSGSTSITNTTLNAFLDSELGSTQGQLLYRDASAWAVLAPGAAGQLLQTNGAAANPSWVSTGNVTTATGAWTPVLKFGGAATGITYATQTGFYVKIGQSVTVSFAITLTSKGSASGVATITGLPFSSSTFTLAASQSTGVHFGNITLPYWLGLIDGGTTIIRPHTTTGAIAQLTNANFANTSQMTATFVYLSD